MYCISLIFYIVECIPIPPPPPPPLPGTSPSVILSVGLSGNSKLQIIIGNCTILALICCVQKIKACHSDITLRILSCIIMFVKITSDNNVYSYLIAIRIKKPIKTKFRLPVFNWTALKPNQINGTVFNEIDDERVLEVILSLTQIYTLFWALAPWNSPPMPCALDWLCRSWI